MLYDNGCNGPAEYHPTIADDGGSVRALRYHKIKRGDTLGAIARKYRISIARLCSLNGIKRTTTLRLGQVLRIS